MNSILLCIAVLVCSTCVNTQSCKTPSNDEGECKSIYECEPLLALIKQKDRTPQDIKLLKDSQCGIRKEVQHVCCSKALCYTPEGHRGQCVGLYSCPHVVNMLTPPAAPGRVEYVKTLVCSGPEKYSVCCSPPPRNSEPKPNCDAVMTAFPPDPRTGCCGVDASEGNRIVGGSIAGGLATGIDEHPWLVAVEYTRSGITKQFCGGGLISGKYVLTAGHCVVGRILKYGTPKNVRLGEYDTENEGPDCVPAENGGTDCTDGALVFPIEQTVPHPLYQPNDSNRKHDIALIRLKNTAPYTDFIRPICLPTADYSVTRPPYFDLFVAGWGRYEDYQNETYLSKVKNHVQLPYKDREECQKSIDSVPKTAEIVLWKGQICAGGEAGKDSCRGASGGPLVFKLEKHFEAVGLVSFGAKKCGTPDVPGVYTNVYEYIPWIASTIKP